MDTWVSFWRLWTFWSRKFMTPSVAYDLALLRWRSELEAEVENKE